MKIRYVVLTLIAGFGLGGCIAFDHALCAPNCQSSIHNSSSLVTFLYPEGKAPPREDALPELRVPLRVGLSFLPSQEGPAKVALAAPHREQLLEKVRARFADRKFVAEIVIVPDYYLNAKGGFEGLEAVQRLYSIDVMALVSYDQVTHLDDNNWSLGYLTIVGAYVLKGSRHDVSTLVDLAVVDPATRSLVLRAGGTDTRHGNTTLIDQSREARIASSAGFDAAAAQMIEHFDIALTKFESDVRAGKANVRIVNRNGTPRSAGGGGLDVIWLVVLGGLVVTCVARRYAGMFALGFVLASSASAQSKSLPAFVADSSGPTRSTVRFELGNTSSVGGSMFLLCRTAAHAGERGFEYFRMQSQQSGARGRGTFEVELFQTVPAGEMVVRADSPATATDPEKALVHAPSWVIVCRQLGVLPAEHKP